MNKYKIFKKVVICLLFCFLLSISKKEAKADCVPPMDQSTLGLYELYNQCYINNDTPYCQSLCVNSISCVGRCSGYEDGEICNKGGSNSQCGTAYCGSNRSDCCYDTYNSWSKYKFKCTLYVSDYGVNCMKKWELDSRSCSIGDKCLTNTGTNGGSCNETGLHSANCNCSYGGIYLYCCDSNGFPETAIKSAWADDGIYPPEAQCPGGYDPNLTPSRVMRSPCPCTAPITGSPGSCGGAANIPTCEAPTANKCADGSNPAVTSSGGYFRWTCPGSAGSCGGAAGADAYCTAQDLPTINGQNGVCASPPNGTTVSTAPTGTLCNYGTTSWTDQIGTDGIFNWNCIGTAGSCSGSNGTTANCSAIKNSPPVFGGLVVKNNLGTSVPAETGNKNQICDGFNGSRVVTFEVSVSDADGIGDITNVTLSWNGTPITRLSAIGAVTTFGADFSSAFNNGNTYPLVVTITDSAGQRTTNSSRSFKFWDCEVPISGTGYDGSSTGATCSSESFSTNTDFPTYKLEMNNVDTENESDDKIMTVSTPNYQSDSSNHLVWGSNYRFTLSDFEANIDGSKFRINGSATCSNQEFKVDNSVADPYALSVKTVIDFSSILDQDPWWQAVGGGVISNNRINNRVPVTCSECKVNINGFVAAPYFSNTGLSDAQDWFYNAKLADVNKNYAHFFDQYFVKKGVGTTLTGDKTIDDVTTTGVYFVSGNLTIDKNKTINPGEFLMIIVKGNINITQDVERVDGILVANNISASGTSPNQLNFYGSLFASDTVNFSRGYDVKSTNNSVSAVKVNYNPELLFRLPGEVAKVLTNFRWGN